MSVYFLRRGEPPATPIVVTITGSGKLRYCYATINGTEQYEAGTHEVYAGDTITFGVFGSQNKSGSVTIDGTKVLTVTGNKMQTYVWTVPSGISTIEIAMTYVLSPVAGKGTITVTTDNNSNNTDHV